MGKLASHANAVAGRDRAGRNTKVPYSERRPVRLEGGTSCANQSPAPTAPLRSDP